MIETIADFMVLTEADFDRLPDGRFEVADGRAILSPPNDYAHQNLSDILVAVIRARLRALGFGYVVFRGECSNTAARQLFGQNSEPRPRCDHFQGKT